MISGETLAHRNGLKQKNFTKRVVKVRLGSTQMC